MTGNAVRVVQVESNLHVHVLVVPAVVSEPAAADRDLVVVGEDGAPVAESDLPLLAEDIGKKTRAEDLAAYTKVLAADSRNPLRHDIVAMLSLQDAVNRRLINADDKLKAVFGGKNKVSMFEMTKLVSNHLK